MIFQDPMMTLNPVLRVDTQMVEAIHAHEKVSAAAARDRARDALAMVGIPSPQERLLAYPHQLSGGMRQRVAIAIALLNRPKLIIADEPTTALDVTIQAQILYEVQKLCRETGTALVWITHDLAVVSGLADRIAVMYAGRIVESGATDDVIRRPSHPYTQGLINSIPTRATHGSLLRQIPGMTPSLLQLPQGCAFRPRCSLCHRHLPAPCRRRRNCRRARACAAGMRWPEGRRRMESDRSHSQRPRRCCSCAASKSALSSRWISPGASPISWARTTGRRWCTRWPASTWMCAPAR